MRFEFWYISYPSAEQQGKMTKFYAFFENGNCKGKFFVSFLGKCLDPQPGYKGKMYACFYMASSSESPLSLLKLPTDRKMATPRT